MKPISWLGSKAASLFGRSRNGQLEAQPETKHITGRVLETTIEIPGKDTDRARLEDSAVLVLSLLRSREQSRRKLYVDDAAGTRTVASLANVYTGQAFQLLASLGELPKNRVNELVSSGSSKIVKTQPPKPPLG